jgi:putative membrane protein
MPPSSILRQAVFPYPRDKEQAMKRLISATVLGCSMALFAGLAPAADGMVRSDRNFMEQAAQNGLAEVEAAKLAQSKSANDKVKTFAAKMQEDHTKTNDELAALASSKSIKLPTEPSAIQKSKAKAMSAMDGAKFDRQYADTMGVKAHEDTLKMFQKAASGAKDADVKAFAAKTVPALQEHLKMSRDLRASLGK